MITQTVINILKNDTTIQNLLGGPHVFITSSFNSTLEKQINVSYGRGRTLPITAGESSKPIQQGTITVYVEVKDSVSTPVKVIDDIMSRICELLDLKGPFNDDFTDVVYWLQKVASSSVKYYDNLKIFEAYIEFKWIAQY